LIVEIVRKTYEQQYSPRTKNPMTSHPFNYVTRATVRVEPEQVQDIKNGYMDGEIMTQIYEQAPDLMGKRVKIQIRQHGKNNGMPVIAEMDL